MIFPLPLMSRDWLMLSRVLVTVQVVPLLFQFASSNFFLELVLLCLMSLNTGGYSLDLDQSPHDHLPKLSNFSSARLVLGFGPGVAWHLLS